MSGMATGGACAARIATAEATPAEAILSLYAQACALPSDIHEHLPLLRDLASQCQHVTELGLRTASGSTLAFLAATPRTLVSWDLNPIWVTAPFVQHLAALAASRTAFQPRTGNTLEVEIEETDLLFFDTLHTAQQLKAELERHGTKARKFLVFHDTMTFAVVGEDGSTPGLRAAIQWFQNEWFPCWRLLEDRENNNGLVVLAREGFSTLEPAGRRLLERRANT